VCLCELSHTEQRGQERAVVFLGHILKQRVLTGMKSALNVARPFSYNYRKSQLSLALSLSLFSACLLSFFSPLMAELAHLAHLTCPLFTSFVCEVHADMLHVDFSA